VASRLYKSAVDAAREPTFYLNLGVADTIEGRYEVIVLHVVLLVCRLREAVPSQSRLAQAVVDFMASDLDRSIRELGVGDLSVGKFMKRLGEGLYGRAAVYEKALDNGDHDLLIEALLRNVYDGDSPGERTLAAIADYVQHQRDHLAGQPTESVATGLVEFLTPLDGNLVPDAP